MPRNLKQALEDTASAIRETAFLRHTEYLRRFLAGECPIDGALSAGYDFQPHIGQECQCQPCKDGRKKFAK